MRITIAGCGRVGMVIAEQLVKERHDIIVVDKSEENVENISNSLDVLPVVGDAASAQVLTDAGVGSSELMIAVTDSDVVNLLICIIAKKIGVLNTIARVRDPIYSQTINLIKDTMGLSFIVNPERYTAKEIINSLLFKGASQVETFAQSANEVITCVVKDKNPVAGMTIRELSKFVGRRILICAIKRDNEIFIPTAQTTIKVNDILSFVARREDAVHFFRKMKYETGKSSDLTIIGGGTLCYYLATMALSNGIPVRIIDKDPEKCRKLNMDLPGAQIMCGDGTDITVLEECGVFGSAAVATTMGSDEKNVLTSMFLLKQRPEMKVITRIIKSDFEDMLYGINIGSVFNPKYIAADRVITYVRAMEATRENEVRSMCHIIDNKVEVLEFRLEENAPHLNQPIQSLQFRKNILLASITRNSTSFIPGGSDHLEAGDMVLVITMHQRIGSFGDIFV